MNQTPKTEHQTMFYQSNEFLQLIRKSVLRNTSTDRRTLKVDLLGRIYFIDSENRGCYLSPKERDKFLISPREDFDYHYDVLN